MRLKLAIFDIDGTLVDSRAVITRSMREAFEALDLPPPGYDQTRHIVGLSLHAGVRQLAPPGLPDAKFEELVEAYRQSFVRQHAEPSFREPLYEGALGLLENLSVNGWLIGIATGKSHKGLARVFEAHPIRRYFDTIWCAEDGPGKPHPFMVEQNLRATGVEASQCLMIGDAIHDMAMARAAGVRAVGVSWGFGETSELNASGAHEVHQDFASLGAALARF
jgi:phosphoglycolate phosphatase